MKAKKIENIYEVEFAAKEISVKVEKAKIKCEILMTEILLKRARRELNRILKEIRATKPKPAKEAKDDSASETSEPATSNN